MTIDIPTASDRENITEGIRQKYVHVATSPEGSFKYPTGRSGMEGLDYPPEALAELPEPAISSYCGVGNPFSLGPVLKGDNILDVGCGGGVDTMTAGMLAGTGGKSVGIDMTHEMVGRARKNLAATKLSNVSFEEASAEDLPFENSSFDVVISNGVLNLVVDKIKAFSEIYRVLKPDGRLIIADQIRTGEPPVDKEQMVKSWFR